MKGPFSKWNKNTIINTIKDNGFILRDEYGGIFSFHHPNANRKDNFHLNYQIYLRRTMLLVCNGNVQISPSIKSHKQLDEYLKELSKVGDSMG